MDARPEPDPTELGPTQRTDRVQQAVEAFVEQRAAGKATDPMTFAEGYPQELRPEILSQCRQFLMFDGMLGAQEWQEDAPDEPDGRLFGDFVIQEELGRGGMGVVYLAHQRSLDRRVAVKVMASGLTLSKRHVERFRREAMATAKLQHPAIVPVHSLIEVDDAYALAMDYVAGRNLGDILDDLRLRNRDSDGKLGAQGVTDGNLGVAPEKGYVAECAMLVAQIASGLAAAHDKQIVHRDLKPRNLMIDDRRQARLLDFGLAKSLDATRESLSMSGEIAGTVHYMSPEQTLAKRVEIDHRADIWSLGVILYELLTLSRPFDGKNLQEIVYEICFKEPAPLQRRNPKVPRDLATICAKALEKDPQNRYATAADLEADLQRFLRWEPVHAKPAGPWTRATKFVRRHRAPSAIAAAALLTVATVLGVVWYREAEVSRRADALLEDAAAQARAGDYPAAITRTNGALELRNDEITRERLRRYYAENKRVENAAAWMVAESRQLLGHDREGAMRLALEAERQLSSAKTRSAVLDVLRSGLVARTLAMPDGVRPMAAAFSPSGERIATAGRRGALRYYRDAAGPPRDLRGHGAGMPVTSIAFVDDRTLVSASADRTLRIWRPDDGAAPVTVPLGDFAPAGMTLDAARRRALLPLYNPAAGRYGVRVYDARTGAPTAPVLEHEQLVLLGALDRDGATAASCSIVNRLRVWSTADNALRVDVKLPLGRTQPSAIAFAPDGGLVAVSFLSGQVLLVSAADGAVLGRARHTDAVTSLAFSPDGGRLLTGSRDATARIWRCAREDGALTVREACVLGGHEGELQHVAFSADGALAATAAGKAGGALRIFDATRDGGSQPLHEYRIGENVRRVAFAPDGRRLLATTSRRALVWSFSAARGAISVRQPGKVPALAFVSGGRGLVTAGDDERLRRWSARDGKLGWQSERLGNPLATLAVDRAGERVAAALVGGAVLVHAAADGAQQDKLSIDDLEVESIQFVARDRLLIAGATTDGGAVALWDLESEQLLARVDVEAAVHATALAPDGALLATISHDEPAPRLWRLPALTPQAVAWPTPAAAARARAVCFSPDGARLLVGDDRGAATVHELDGAIRFSVQTPGPVRSVAFSPDGTALLTCSSGDDGSAQLWRTVDGVEQLHFTGHRGTLLYGRFSHSGAWVATSASDGSVWIWPTDPVAVAGGLPLRDADDAETRPR